MEDNKVETPIEEPTVVEEVKAPEPEPAKEETITVSRAEFESLKSLVEAVSDKGRMLAYQTRQAAGTKPINIKLSKFAGGYIVAWKNSKDTLVYHPTTGRQVGEEQEYTVKVLKSDGAIEEIVMPLREFNEVKYADRVTVQVVGKSEDYDGKLTYKVQLPDGRIVDIGSPFVN